MESPETGIWSERWRLAALSRTELIKLSLVSLIIGIVFAIFHLQGNTTDIRMFGRSAIQWMVARWNESGGDFSHGYLIPFVSLALIWHRRHELAAATKSVSHLGLAIVIMALLTHWLGAKAQQTRLSLIGLIGLAWGIPFYLYGKQVAKLLLFPCAYLIFCIPLNFIDSMTSPLRIFATIVSTAILQGLGMRVHRIGSGIISDSSSDFSFDVAPECSGLRSLLAMTALTAVYALLTQKTIARKWGLFLCSVPIALVGNIVRIVMVVLVAEAFGKELALGLWHDYSGYLIFAVGIGLMLGAGSLFNLDYKMAWTRWKQKFLSPIS